MNSVFKRACAGVKTINENNKVVVGVMITFWGGSSDSGSDYFLKRSGPNSDLNPILKTFHNSIHYYSENIHDSG